MECFIRSRHHIIRIRWVGKVIVHTRCFSQQGINSVQQWQLFRCKSPCSPEIAHFLIFAICCSYWKYFYWRIRKLTSSFSDSLNCIHLHTVDFLWSETSIIDCFLVLPCSPIISINRKIIFPFSEWNILSEGFMVREKPGDQVNH